MKHRRWFKRSPWWACAHWSSRRRVPTTAAAATEGRAPASVDCATVEFGCVEVAAGDPIDLGSAALDQRG